jgi:hypothetical protein
VLQDWTRYSRLPPNLYPSVDGPGYGVLESMGYEGLILVKIFNLVAAKTMGYEGVDCTTVGIVLDVSYRVCHYSVRTDRGGSRIGE